MIRDALVTAVYAVAKALCYLGDWLARQGDEVWRSRAWDIYDGPLDDTMTSLAALRNSMWPHGKDFDGYPPAEVLRLEAMQDAQLEYVDPCQECDGSCGVCDALKMPAVPDPRTDTTPWTLRGNAFHATRDAD